ncbi:nucleotidyltransferase domain-containing protein [Vibrio owensii]|uniref:nucleotidyltransferase domain-containing protein n=1 Tax=Vibrio owensii TaxID=696485 RepID=UPI00148BE15F|nr:nucleotidyltransferase [Vibrio owensii]NOI69613.1 nucleotidyltransferase [Vibrio owensii]
MAIQTHFIKFHNRIKLTRESSDYKEAREKDDSILSQVKTAFRDEGYPVVDNFLQGSFSTNTAIHNIDGDFDIDHAVVIDYFKAPDDPVVAKRTVKRVLDERGFKNAKIKKPCITADYLNLSLHIDIPVYAKYGSSYKLALGKMNSNDNHRKWTEADPKGLRDWINDTNAYWDSPNDTQQQFIRLVRYTKRWRDHNFSSDVRKKVFSIGLTVMLKENFEPSFDENGRPEDLAALRATIGRILSSSYFFMVGEGKYNLTVALPVTPYIDIFNGSSVDTGTQLYNKLSSLKSKLEQIELEQDVTKQCKTLNQIFGADFEVPECDSSSKSNLAAFSSAGIVGTSQGA